MSWTCPPTTGVVNSRVTVWAMGPPFPNVGRRQVGTWKSAPVLGTKTLMQAFQADVTNPS